MNKQTGFIAAVALTLTTAALAQNTNRPVAAKFDVSERQRTDTTAFWTHDMLSNAVPMPLPKLDPLAQTRTDAAFAVTTEVRGVMRGGAPSFAPSKADQPNFEEIVPNHTEKTAAASIQAEGFDYLMPFTNHRMTSVNVYPYSAVGKLFFFIPQGTSEPSGTYVCSASVAMNSHTLMTARHCIYDYATGKLYSSFVFYPAYAGGGNPAYHGGWTLRNFATWVSNAGSYDYDIAFAQVNDDRGYGCNGSSGGTPIGNYTGWFGATWNGDFSKRQWDILGYPAEYPFAGYNQWDDEAATGALNPFGATNIVEVGNPQTGGTSGGPWVIGLSPAAISNQGDGNNVLPSYTNLVNGLNSFKWTNPDHADSINGPAFYTYNFLNLYNYFAGYSCP